MRISDSFVFSSLNKHLIRTKGDLAVAQERASSGLKVGKPSDDPVAFAAARRERHKMALAEAGMKGADLALTQMTGAEEALSLATDGLARAKELALSGASDTMGAEQRRNLAEEVRKIREHMVTLGNTNVAGSYVFAGYRDDQPPYDNAGVFSGDNTVKEVSPYPGLKVSGSISGEDAFGVAGSSDVFSALDNLIQALESNSATAVRDSVADVDLGERRLLSTRSRLGSMMDGVQTARAVSDRYAFTAEVEAGRLTEVDEVQAIGDMLKAKNALEVALATAQQIPTAGLIKQRG
jgi:flagellar hook-associated protein 3 FlgL